MLCCKITRIILWPRRTFVGRISLTSLPARRYCLDEVNREKFLFDLASREMLMHLCKYFKITNKNVALKTLAKYPSLANSTVENVVATTDMLLELGVKETQLRKYPWLLSLKTNEIATKITKYSIISTDPAQTLVETLKNNYPIQRWMPIPPQYYDRVLYLANELEQPLVRMAILIEKFKFMIIIPEDKLKRRIKTMKEAGITSEMIFKDFWAFRYGETLMHERIQRCKAVEIPIKTWMFRCPEEIFANSLTYWTRRMEVLRPHEDVVNFLKDRLQCSEADITEMCRKNDKLCKVSPMKLQKFVEFLKSKDYSNEEICHNSRIFNFSLETISARFEELSEMNLPLPRLKLLHETQKKYEKFLGKLGKRKELLLEAN